ncbi:putative ATPase [Bacilli bacterium PM5-3]|nr:putative ATPase [Bacilli bacterium PM5-3]MDH6603742.1 putative ATPase [Bacilli bacterium PM5-9]
MEKNSMLANTIRPTNLDDVIGQEHLVGKNGVIRKMVDKQKILSMILYGNAGCGKTTIARIITSLLDCDYLEINATNSNKKDLENAIARARLSSSFILIIDEIHRMNKDKQDILLPHIESGLITLIGLTNSNPYHSINSAIRSRVILLEVKKISEDDLKTFLKRVIKETSLKNYKDSDKVISHIIKISNQDVRYAINQLELLDLTYEKGMSLDDLFSYLSSNVSIDKNDNHYYDVISSLQKSIRGSDVNAALFYLAILILSEDLDIIERRLSIIAYEDVGLANPMVVDRVHNALRTARMVGFPEARIPLAFCVVDLALSSKSNKAYEALNAAIECAKESNYNFNEYMQATPMDHKQKELYWKIPYENKHLIQYLPNEVKEKKFYHPNRKSSYEKHLALLNDYLNEISRSNNLEELLKKINKQKNQ